MARIVVVGSFNTDLTVYTERLPRPGETVAGERFVPGPGGKGANQAVAAARLGAAVGFVGRIGTDVFAPLAHELFASAGVDTRHLVEDPDHATGVAPVLVDAHGENSIVVVLGANLAIEPADIEAASETIAAADVLLTQLEIPLAATRTALEIARRCHTIAILNPAPAVALPPEVLALADLVTPNQTELELLCSHVDGIGAPAAADAAGDSDAEIAARARRLLVRPDQRVVVTLGRRGALVVAQAGHQAIPTFAVEAVDTTGAGDAFNGALAVGIAEGMALDAATHFANATAALSVTRPGTAPSMPHRDAVDALLGGPLEITGRERP